MKKVLVSIPLAGALASVFAAGGGASGWTPDQDTVTAATGELETWGGYIIAGIGGVVAVAAGLRLLVKGINRAVGK